MSLHHKLIYMKNQQLVVCFLIFSQVIFAQDLSYELLINDLELHPMQDIAKPGYLETIVDPSFGTTIRRISNAADGTFIVPVYSTIQAWNTDESLMILYDGSVGTHQLLDGTDYTFIRYLDDISPDDLEQLFWDHEDPDVLFYLESGSDDFISYNIISQVKTILANLDEVTTSCTGSISLGNDVQMMSWNSDIISFRCNNDAAYYYRISTGEVTAFNITDIAYTAPMPGPSGELFYHRNNVYDMDGNLLHNLNENSTEHSCMGKMSNGNDAHFAIAFAQGPEGGCLGDIIAHDIVTGECTPLISQEQGYDYPQSGTHISAVSHNNTDGGWLAASMMGYDRDGQELLDQELVIVKADGDNPIVCRIGHHRSDEDQFDYWGEPHATISPSGTRVLFASDWSGAEDGNSVDSYIVELPIYENTTSLAVEFDFINCYEKDNYVVVEWQSASEINHDYYVVQKSKDSKEWSSVKKVNVNASQSLASYKIIDTSPYTGNSYYRIVNVDQAANHSYSSIYPVNVETSEILLFPNPCADILNVKIKRSNTGAMKIVNSMGQDITERAIVIEENNEQIILDVKSLTKGIYYFLYNEQNILFSKL